MAELIPLEYRLAMAQRQGIHRWTVITAVAAGLAVCSIAASYIHQHKQFAAYAALRDDYYNKSKIIEQSKKLIAGRRDLADRMQKLQELRDDKTLLALLHNVSGGFSDNDVLSYISIDAHGLVKSGTDKADKTLVNHYSVRIVGDTVSGSTHGDLVDRLSRIGATADPPMTVSAENTRREQMLDGEVVRFQIACDQPTKPGN